MPLIDNLNDPNAVNTAGNGTFFRSINDGGQIVGDYAANGSVNGFLETGGAYVTINYPNSVGTWPSSINDQGSIVGYYLGASFIVHAFLLHNGLTTQDDPKAGTGGGEGTVAISFNNIGDLLVGRYIDNSNVSHGYIETDGGFITIDAPNAGTAAGQGTYASSVNDLGQIVGGYSDSKGVSHGFAFINGVTVTGDDPNAGTANGQGTFVNSINNAGQIVGYYISSNNVAHAFLFSDGVYTTADDPNAGTASGEGTFATSINNAGELVGYYIDSNHVAHGYVIALSSSIPVVTLTGAGGHTSQPVQMFSGMVDAADAGSIVTVQDGAIAIGSAVVQTDGNWSLGATLSGNGPHVITAHDSNVFGTGVISQVIYTLDPNAPAAGILESLTPPEETAAIYAGYFDRAPDPSGFQFWEGQFVTALNNGQSRDVALKNISNSFTPQPETAKLYPFLSSGPLDPNNAADVNGVQTLVSNIYDNLFHRVVNAATDAGAQYWVQQILKGQVALGEAILDIANGATGVDAQVVMNKVVVGSYFASHTAALPSQPANLLVEAGVVLVGIDSTQSSLVLGIATIQGYH